MSAADPAAGIAAACPLVYVSMLAGRRYATQWMLDRGLSGGLQAFEFLTETDPAAAGAGGGLVRQRSRLLCTCDGAPVRYVSDVSGAKTDLRFEGDSVSVTLPDGSPARISLAGAEFIVDGNGPGQLALIFESLWRRGAFARAPSVRTKLFFTGQLTTVPCEIATADDLDTAGLRFFRTSHKEDVGLDDGGVVREIRVPHLGFVATRQDAPPPAPDWPDDLALDRPPLRYTPPAGPAFRLEDVTVAGPVVPIGATLSIPRGPGPFPAVLFVSGSGTHDRHGIAGEIDIGSHELMDGLAAQGFVGLRFDTRGAGATGLGADALDRGLASDIADARACLRFLRSRPEIAGQPLFLIGHSQGGTEVLALATDDATRGAVHGVVLMATMGRGLDEVMCDQIVAQGRVLDYTPQQVGEQVATLREAVALARAGTPWEPGQVPDHVLAMFRTATWLRDHLACRPQDMIARLACPVLVCQGAMDFQVSAKRDAEPLVAAARAAGVACSYALFSDLDHLFKRTQHSTLAEYYEPRPVDPRFLATVHRWLGTLAGSERDFSDFDDAGADIDPPPVDH